jgi:tRNA A37 methylthiotransferase MiaB
MTDQELRDKIHKIQGMIEAIRFPIVDAPDAYYDLIDLIAEQYQSVLKELVDD